MKDMQENISRNDSASLIEEINIMIRARYPLIYVVTWEEKRVENMLLELARNRNKSIFNWTITQGIQNLEAGTAAKKLFENTQDPVAALDYIEKYQKGALFLLKDFHPYMHDARVIRRLRDLTVALKTSFKTIILVSPVPRVPEELEKDMALVDFPLPILSELGKKLDDIVNSVKHNPNVQINLQSGDREKILQAAQGLTLVEAENVFAKAIVAKGRLDAHDIPLILQEKKQIIRKSGILEYFSPEQDINSVGGLDHLKSWMRKRSTAFSETARNYGLPHPKGVLLIGVSGSGKSLVAKAVSALWNLPLLRLDIGSVFSGLVGSSEANIRTVIKTAESIAPCLLWLDELDKGMSGVHSSNFSDGGTTARVLSSFLTWMQEKTAPVFLIATANDISALPPELLRKGRFDEIFFLDLPSQRERMDIFRIHLTKRGRLPDQFDIKLMADLSKGFSGAEIEQVVISALYDSFDSGRELQNQDMISTIRQSVPLSHTMREAIDALRQWAQTRARPASGDAQDMVLGE
jgi:ATP-dependent 26S proteasome regulatory subunit